VRISGATGENAAYVNGLFEVTDEVSGGMPVYKRKGGLTDQVWLEYHVARSSWMVRNTEFKGQELRKGEVARKRSHSRSYVRQSGMVLAYCCLGSRRLEDQRRESMGSFCFGEKQDAILRGHENMCVRALCACLVVIN